VGDVWGVGRKHTEKLLILGIKTVEDLRIANPDRIRSQFSIVLGRTVQELNNVPCIELDESGVPRQQIMVSRSFGQCVANFDDLSESVAYYATTAAEKLRHDGSVASSVCVFARTNPFNEKEPQYERSVVVPLHPTDDTSKIIGAALAGLKQIFRVGFQYKKTGVLLMGLHPKGTMQADLFDEPTNQTKSDNLMKVMDSINRKMGKGSLVTAASGGSHRWAMRREKMSPNFTTDWNELPVVY